MSFHWKTTQDHEKWYANYSFLQTPYFDQNSKPPFHLDLVPISLFIAVSLTAATLQTFSL